MRRSKTLLFALIALTGCASSAPGPATRPIVSIEQTSILDPIEAAATTAIPVDFRLNVTNPFGYPVTLTSVEVETVGLSGGYTMKRVRHAFGRIIPAHAADSIDLRAWVQPLQISDRGDVTAPVMLRGIARFDAEGKPLQTSFAGRAIQRVRD